MKRAAAYVRVSTMEQANEGYSIPAQTDKLANYAKAKDMIVAKTYTDPGFSGAKMERPALQEMINDIEKGLIDCVLVYKLDRLSRSQKNTLYLIEDVFLKNNVDFISLQESFDTSTPFGRATIGMLSVFAQLERDTITERMTMGRTERAKEGYYHGSGIVPLGYDYVDGELIINKFEAMIIKEMYSLYLSGKGQNHIARALADKYPSYVKTRTIVKYALTNPIYTGKITFKGEVYQGHHTPIISLEDFEKVQEIYGNKKKFGQTRNNQASLLAGLIYCGNCGAKIFRETSGGKYKYQYYTCYSVKKVYPSLVKDINCKQKRFRTHLVDSYVINMIKDLNYQEVMQKAEKIEKELASENKPILNQIRKLEKQKTKIIDLYQFGNINIEDLNKRIEQIDQEKNALNAKLLTESHTVKETKEILKDIKSFNWEIETTERKIEMINLIVNRVEIKGDEINVTFNF